MAAQELYRLLRPGALLGSVSEAEDLVQEGLLRLHRALEDGAGDLETLESARGGKLGVFRRLRAADADAVCAARARAGARGPRLTG